MLVSVILLLLSSVSLVGMESKKQTPNEGFGYHTPTHPDEQANEQTSNADCLSLDVLCLLNAHAARKDNQTLAVAHKTLPLDQTGSSRPQNPNSHLPSQNPAARINPFNCKATSRQCLPQSDIIHLVNWSPEQRELLRIKLIKNLKSATLTPEQQSLLHSLQNWENGQRYI